MASRNKSYKLKSSVMDKREKRLLRVHRRSLDQREMRQEGMNKRRQIEIDDMSPVVESQDVSTNPCSATPVPVHQNAAMSRLERLKKWKEERELKRKLESMERAKTKPGFKVAHVKYTDKRLFQDQKEQKTTAGSKQAEKVQAQPKPSAVTSVKPKPKPKAAVAAPPTIKPKTIKKKSEPAQPMKKVTTVTRTTRSNAASARPTPAAAPKPTKNKQPSPKRAGRSHFMAPTAASRTRAAASAQKAPAQAPERKKVTRSTQPKVKDAGKVSTHRGDHKPRNEPSFAPSDFVFAAPGNVSSFVFKPLSPASASSFLFPNNDSTTMSAFNDRVGRTSTPKRDGPLASSSASEQKDSDEDLKASPTLGASEPGPARKNSTNVGAKSDPPVDSGIEITSVEVNEKRNKTMAQAAPSGEEEECINMEHSSTTASADVSTPKQNRKRMSTRQRSTHDRQDATVNDIDEPSDKKSDSSFPDSMSKKSSRRKSKRVSIKEKFDKEAEDVEEDKTPAKSTRRSRRSAVAESDSAIQNGAESQTIPKDDSALTSPSGNETLKQRTPRRSRRSRRSVAVTAESVIQEETPMEVVPVLDENAEDMKKENKRASRKGSCSYQSQDTDADITKESQVLEMENTATTAEQTNVQTAKSRRRSQCSAAWQEDAVKNIEDSTKAELSQAKPISPTKASEEAFPVPDDLPKPSTPERSKLNLQGKRAKDDLFLTPGPPVSSQKRSTAKRRRTAAMVALSTAKSPEEAIKIISTSPMIELTRRTPKSKVSPELRKNSTAALFDDDDFTIQPVQLSSVFDAPSTDDTTTTTDDATSSEASNAQAEPAVTESTDLHETGEVRDVSQFRERLAAETAKLTELADHWTTFKESTPTLPEEIEGQIRSTALKAQLLMGKKGKFQQFAGLVDKCQAGDPSTTCQDLQGFWDMVFLQAEDFYSKFDELERLKQNNWQPEAKSAPVPTQPIKKVVKKSAPSGVKKAKPAVKSKFAEFRAQMMKQRKTKEVDGQVGSQVAPEEKVFDAGFFKVASPVKSPQYHCDAGTPTKRKSEGLSADRKQTPAVSKAASTEHATTSTTTTSTATTDNKENVAHVLLRRSIGGGRKSYTPTIPSPLLQDGVSARCSVSPPKSPAKGVDTGAGQVGEMDMETNDTELRDTPTRPRRPTPRRRSTRSSSRKSVSFAAEEPQAGGSMASDGEEQNFNLMAYFKSSTPGQPTSPLKESVMDNSPFSCEDVLKHSADNTPAPTALSAVSPQRQQSTARGRKSSLKVLPSKERRKSRRSVSFALSPSKLSSSSGISLPSTPYNRDSLVAGRRVSRRSLASPNSSHSIIDELQELSGTPRTRRSARPSLLYTPPKVDESRPRTPAKEVPVAELVSFSP